MPKIFHTDTREEWLALRREDVTSTEISALFGHSPHLTPFELYLQKTGQVSDEIEANERMELGQRLEPVIAGYAAEKMDWKSGR